MAINRITKDINICIRQLYTASEQGIFFIDAEGHILQANDSFCAMLGYAGHELMGKTFFDINQGILPNLVPSTREGIADFGLYYFYLAEQAPLPIKLLASDGTPIQVTMRSVITRTRAGETAVAAGIITLIKKQGQEEQPRDPTHAHGNWELEQNYRNILQHSGDGIIITDFNSMIVTVNDSLVSMLGYERSEDIVGKFLLELASFEGTHMCTTGEMLSIDKGYYDTQIEVTNELFETGRAQGLFYMNKKDGVVVPMEAALSLLTDPEGNRRGTIAICRDITTRVKAEKQLLNTKLFLENIFATTRDGIYVSDPQGQCIMINQAFSDITGYRQEELIGGSAASLLADDSDAELSQQIMKAMDNKDDLSLFEARWKRKNGTVFPAEVRLAVLKTEAGDYNGIVASVRDITERRRVLEELRQSHEQLEEKVRERTETLEEMNTALRVLLQGREEDKQTHEDKILANVNELVLPYLDRLKATRLDERQRSSLAIIEANLKDIVAPFAGRTASRNLSMTPAEIQIANLIKHGMTAKEIAGITSLSPRTIECHRASIRKKLGLINRKVNLRAYLLSSG
ncbi:MAG: PAS domain S-box protein [Deltaproteobacteria bacterium]|nr:PAS domain S-box protein [Deltaproteobacteria bacterium]